MARHRITLALFASAIVAAAAPTYAQTTPLPPTVQQKVAAMHTACSAAGGRPGPATYIFAYDFTGDGRTDYLLSEGNYNCIGRPAAFRANGRAVVEVYIAEGADARRVFYDIVRGYRVLDGFPRRVQIIREGTACSPPTQGTCTIDLRWDPMSRRLGTEPVTATSPMPGTPPPPRGPAPAASILTAAQVRSEIVGHRVSAADGGMHWYYYANGKYDGDDGRNARGGTYVVRPDGRLCWRENSGISGCFEYYRGGGRLQVRRADPDNRFELGAVTVSRLPP